MGGELEVREPMKSLTMMVLSSMAAVAAGACAELGEEPDVDVQALPEQVTWRDQVYDRADLAAAPTAARRDDAAYASGSRAELAEALRMSILHPNGGLYVAREPNWAAADAVRSPQGPIERTPVARGERRRPAAADDSLESALERLAEVVPEAAARVIGADSRTLSPHTTAPFHAITRVETFTSATGGGFRKQCTGAYIGPWTFVLAGHCVRFTDGTTARRIVFQRGRAGGSIPFQRDCRNGDASTSNDFLLGIPAGYTGTLDNSLDFAVIDTFPCHGTGTTHFPGYVVDSGTVSYNVHGYPIGLCPGASAEGTFMCGNGGQGYINEWRLESEHVDTTDGEDGAPWWTINPTRVAGVDIGYREYFDLGRCGFSNCQRNYARRIDGGMDAFIRSIAFDF